MTTDGSREDVLLIIAVDLFHENIIRYR